MTRNQNPSPNTRACPHSEERMNQSRFLDTALLGLFCVLEMWFSSLRLLWPLPLHAPSKKASFFPHLPSLAMSSGFPGGPGQASSLGVPHRQEHHPSPACIYNRHKERQIKRLCCVKKPQTHKTRCAD